MRSSTAPVPVSDTISMENVRNGHHAAPIDDKQDHVDVFDIRPLLFDCTIESAVRDCAPATARVFLNVSQTEVIL